MATTAKPIDFLVSGVRDTAGVAVASGKCRWYLPGTLTPAVAYSDAACTTPITAPLTLNAGGQGTIFCLEPVRLIVKDTTETVSYYDSIAPLQRHDSVYVTHPSFNGGAETTLEVILGTLGTNLGTNFQFQESAGATPRSYTTRLGEEAVSVKDFNAVGDGVTDDTVAIQAASDRVEARGGGWVEFPVGTYKITSAISIDTVGVCWRGCGRRSIIKNFSTTGNTLSINVGSSIDSKVTIRDLAITANTTSSGKGIVVTNGNRTRIENVAVGLHQKGIEASAVSEAQVLGCTVESTDDQAGAVGISIATRGRADNCNIVSATGTGTGLVLAADCRGIDCYVEKFSTGVSLSTAGAQCRGTLSTLANVGFSLGAANTIAEACWASGAATGFSVGVGASCSVTLCRASTCTTDLSVNAAATLFEERGNSFAGTVTNAAASPSALPLRTGATTATPGLTPTITPNISGGFNVLLFHFANGTGGTVTIAAHATATLAVGDVMVIAFFNLSGGANTYVWNTQYRNPDISGISDTTQANLTSRTYWFRWSGTQFIKVMRAGDAQF